MANMSSRDPALRWGCRGRRGRLCFRRRVALGLLARRVVHHLPDRWVELAPTDDSQFTSGSWV